MKTAGIDSCKAGWILISFTGDGPEYRLLRTDEELEKEVETYDRIFIDIPVGLNDETYSRECDVKLREMLGSDNGTAIIDPPIRPALNSPSYVEANMQNFEFTGKELSLQAWNMTPKIRVIDRILQQEEALKEVLLPSHPELLFFRLNGGRIFQNKQTKKGLKHRLSLAADRNPVAVDIYREIKEEFRRNEVEEEVIVDAIALAGAVYSSIDKPVKTVPESPEIDSKGFKKAFYYV